MSIKCAHCGGRHTKLETVRQCAIDAGVDEKSLPKIEREMWLPTLGSSAPVRHKPHLPPAGYYWLPGDIVVKIRISTGGRWDGRYFVVACNRTSNQEKLVFGKADREEFLQWLVSQNHIAFMSSYGKNTGYCSACGGQMSPSQARTGYHFPNGPYGTACAETVQNRYFI